MRTVLEKGPHNFCVSPCASQGSRATVLKIKTPRISRIFLIYIRDCFHFGIPSAELEDGQSAFQVLWIELHSDRLAFAGHQ